MALQQYVNGQLVTMTAAEEAAFEAARASAPVDPTANFIPVPLLRQRLEKLGLFEDFSAYLAQYPVLMLKVLSLESGVDPTYPDLLAAFDAMAVPQNVRAYLLAPPSVGVPDV